MFVFLPNPVAWERNAEKPVPRRNDLKLAVSLEKLCALMKGLAGLLMPQRQDGKGWNFGCSKQHLPQGTGHKTDELVFSLLMESCDYYLLSWIWKPMSGHTSLSQ